jgi:hypothetical protein
MVVNVNAPISRSVLAHNLIVSAAGSHDFALDRAKAIDKALRCQISVVRLGGLE